MDTAEDIASTAIRLAQAGGLPFWAVLALILVAAVLLVGGPRLWSAMGKLKVTPSEPPLNPGLPIQSGEGGGVVDSSGRPVTHDPENPGGGPTGGMG